MADPVYDEFMYLPNEAATDPGAGGGGFGAVEAGLAFAAAGYLADQHANKVTRELKESFQQEHSHGEPSPQMANAAENWTGPTRWEQFVGQEHVKKQMLVHINSAKSRGAALDHTLLASAVPGSGKTTLAHIVAHDLGTNLIKLVPPFHKDTLFEAVMSLNNRDILFVDEIHKMSDNGPAMAENLLHILEEGVIYTNEGAVRLADITVIGATTDSGKLPEAVLDRFVIKPHFAEYSVMELALIAAGFRGKFMAGISDDVVVAIAHACRGTPRVARELVMAGRDLSISMHRSPTAEELLEFKQLDPDGMTLAHRNYLLSLYENFARKGAGGKGVEYIAGASSIQKVLRETKGGLAALERFLLRKGYIDQTPSGRRLTPSGIAKAESYQVTQ